MQRTWQAKPWLLMAGPLAAAVIGGCGGGDERTEYERLVDEAQALKTQAVARVEAGPCADDSHCTGLVFGFTAFYCGGHDQHTFSVLSPGRADAERLAAEQRAVARRAQAIEPPSDTACTLGIQPPPRHVCVAQRCEQRPGEYVTIPAG